MRPAESGIVELNSNLLRGYKYFNLNETLEIYVADGMVYQYFQVPEYIIEGLSEAKNKDFYYRRYIRTKFKRLFKTYNY
ncbi:MAG TPA: KTSC domain-containing protein [Bacteroidales bacterium]|nr:KTSC domain-containing protein [Bacteroidales bacterium]HRX98259.1 KTSC domain-containing protein [Bacteroidales bacterium]